MTLSWTPVIVVDVLGSALTLGIAFLCARIALVWKNKKRDDIFRQYIFLLTISIVIFAISRSFGHLVKQALVYLSSPDTWQIIAPFSGAVNTATFIVIAAFCFYFDQFKRVHNQLEQYKDNLEELVGARTNELAAANSSLLEEIGERRRAEETLIQSEEQVRLLLNSTAEGIYGIDTEGRCTFVNPSFMRMLGYEDEQQLLGRNMHDLIHHTRIDGKPYPVEDCRIYQAFREGLAIHIPEETFWKADNSKVLVECRSHPILHHGRVMGAVVTFIDVSEKRKMEDELSRAQKLESIGILAGGIAHDFNNLLQAIMGNISLGRLYADPETQLSQCLDEAEKATHRARDLTQQLLTFSKGGEPVKKAVALGKIIIDSCSFAIRGSNCECEYSLPDDLRSVEADAGQVSQIFHNLALNATQAMPEGGTIRVQARNVTVGREEIPPLTAGEYVAITFKDQGVGIIHKHLKNIFDPYFSTKKRGSGLGLAVTYSIIKKHHGHITVDSEIGRGTSFTIYLPVSAGTVEAGPVGDCLVTGSGRILVMDDEAIVRNLVGRLLERLGYECALAADGEEAIAMYLAAKKEGRPFAAAIMDLTIPAGMGGREAIARLKELDPAVKAIVSSGYANDPIMANYQKYGFVNVIPKPYTSQTLSQVLREVFTPGRDQA